MFLLRKYRTSKANSKSAMNRGITVLGKNCKMYHFRIREFNQPRKKFFRQKRVVTESRFIILTCSYENNMMTDLSTDELIKEFAGNSRKIGPV